VSIAVNALPRLAIRGAVALPARDAAIQQVRRKKFRHQPGASRGIALETPLTIVLGLPGAGGDRFSNRLGCDVSHPRGGPELEEFAACWEGLDDPSNRGMPPLHDLQTRCWLISLCCCAEWWTRAAVDIGAVCQGEGTLPGGVSSSFPIGLPSHGHFQPADFAGLIRRQFRAAVSTLHGEVLRPLSGRCRIDGKGAAPSFDFDRAQPAKSALPHGQRLGLRTSGPGAGRQIATDAKVERDHCCAEAGWMMLSAERHRS